MKCYFCCSCYFCCCYCSGCYCSGCCWSHKPTFKVWLKSGQEQLRYGWHWVCGGGGWWWWWVVGGGWWWSKVIFLSNPTFELSWGWVWVVTIIKIILKVKFEGWSCISIKKEGLVVHLFKEGLAGQLWRQIW